MSDNDEMVPFRLKRRALADRHPESADEIRELQRQLLAAQQEAGALRTKFEHLQQIYNKLADQWNVFQATSRPDNRNIQRAEGAGEMARKLAEIFLSVSYDTDARDLITNLLEKLREAQAGAAGREVEVSQKLVGPRHG